MRIASWHLTEMPGSHTVHLLLTQLHNAAYFYIFIFTIIIFSAKKMMMMMMMRCVKLTYRVRSIVNNIEHRTQH